MGIEVTTRLEHSELNHARAMVARCEAKKAAASDAASRRYYELCAAGWRRWLERLERGR